MILFFILILSVGIILPLNLTDLLKNVADKKSTAKNTFINIICLLLIFSFIFFGPR